MSRTRISTALCLLAIAALTAWFWVRGERFIAANGQTFDEGVHLAAGYRYWKTGFLRMNSEDPPLLKWLWAVPFVTSDAPPVRHKLAEPSGWLVADSWLSEAGPHAKTLIDRARHVNLAIGCGIIWLVAWAAYRGWQSRMAAVAAAAFATADPTLLSLSCILSTDFGLAFGGLLTTYFVWEYVRTPSKHFLFATGISLGLTLATKFSAVGVVAGLVTAALHFYLRGGRLALPGVQERGIRQGLELAFRIGAIAIVVVAATYLFWQFGLWPDGLKFQLTRSQHSDGVFYLNGELSRTGWSYYFAEALVLKLPLGLIAAAALSAAITIASAWRKPESAFFIVTPVVFLALASYSGVDVGVRAVIPVIPFVYLLAGGLASEGGCRVARLSVFAICLGWNVYVTEKTSPSELIYTNELTGLISPNVPPLLDSNLDWGQGLPALKAWMDSAGVDHIDLAYFGTDHPERYGIHYQRLPGYGQLGDLVSTSDPVPPSPHYVAVSVNLLHGLYLNDPELYAWLRQRKPVTTLDGSIYVFDSSDDPAAVKRLRIVLDR